jgi:hypothetical protein
VVKELTRALEPRRPFNDLPPFPPPGFDMEPKPVLKSTVEA